MKKIKIGLAFGDNFYETHKLNKYKNHLDFNKLNPRIYLILILILIVVTLFIIRLFSLEIINSSYYKILSDNNRTRTQVIHAPRGIIFDRYGNPLVYNMPGFREKNGNKTIFLNSSQVVSKLENNKNLSIDSLRFYPYKDALAHVVGYVGQISPGELSDPNFSNYGSDAVIGKMGIEQFYDKSLRGVDGKKLIEVDANGNYVKTLGETDSINGENINLTIDKNLQERAYNLMKNVKGSVVVSRPDGQILAMVSTPSFDPNLFTLGSSYKTLGPYYKNVTSIIRDSKNQPLLNRSISGVYPPGSTFKLVVAATALENNVINKNFTIDDTGIIKIGNFSFSNWYYSQYGRTDGIVDVTKAIQRSNDIFFYQVGHLLGVNNLSKGAAKFGLGKPLGIDLMGEASGFLPTSLWKEVTFGQPWYLGDDYHYGIGQGYLLVTPLQVNAWTQAVANGGILYRPHLNLNLKPYILASNLLNQTNFNLIRTGMIEACSPGGVAYPLYNYEFPLENAKHPIAIDGKNFFTPVNASESANFRNDIGVSVACKTGTAQQGSATALPHAWLTLFAPAYNPQVIITVLVEDGGEGSTVAGPIAKQILDAYFEK